MNYHSMVTLAKKVLFPNGEPYVYKSTKLRFKVGSRPIRRKYIDSKNDIVRNDLLQIEYIEKNFTGDDVLWDIGSHHGHYSIFAALVVKGDNQVFSFEPDPAARRIQLRNLAINHLENRVQVMDIAVSNRNGSLKFNFQGGNSNSHLVSDDYTSADAEIITVPSRTINSLLNELPQPTFVKIDTEGAEIDILSEATSLLSNKNVTFICELHPFAWDKFRSSFGQLTSLLNQFGRELKLMDQSRRFEDLPFYGTVLF